MIISFKKTQHKISLIFATSAIFLLLLSASLIFVFMNWQMEKQAQMRLEQHIEGMALDYKSDLLSNVDTSYQKSNFSIMESAGRASLPNISKYKEDVQQELDKDFAKDEEIEEGKVIDVASLKKSQGVYSRVILSDGSILFDSDLFDAIYINPDIKGFKKHQTDDSCVHVLTAELTGVDAGTIIQVADYCAVNSQLKRAALMVVLFVTITSSIFSYFFGLATARRLMKPLQKSAKKTREFALRCYHELLTPITMATTSVAAAIRTKEYEKGLKSVESDLKEVHAALDLISSTTFRKNSNIQVDSIDLGFVVNNVLNKMLKKYQRSDVVIKKDQVESGIKKRISETAWKLILSNLIINTLKFTKKNGIIELTLNKDLFKISNEIDNDNLINVKSFFKRSYRGENANGKDGYGLGLSLVKELVNNFGWKIDAKKESSKVEMKIEF